MNGKLNVIVSRVYSLIQKAKVRYAGREIGLYWERVDAILDRVPFAIRNKVLRKVNRIEEKEIF